MLKRYGEKGGHGREEKAGDREWDFNAVGRRAGRKVVFGRYSLGVGCEAGRDLVELGEEIGLAHVNSFVGFERKGCLKNPATVKRCEVDGYLERRME